LYLSGVGYELAALSCAGVSGEDGRKVGDLVKKEAGIELPIDSDRVRKLSRPLTFSCEKAKKVLGYEAVEKLGEGIRREVGWLYPQRS